MPTLAEIVIAILIGLLGWGVAALLKLSRPKVWGIVAFAVALLSFILNWVVIA